MFETFRCKLVMRLGSGEGCRADSGAVENRPQMKVSRPTTGCGQWRRGVSDRKILPLDLTMICEKPIFLCVLINVDSFLKTRGSDTN
jgi:hypothetical protein